MRPRENWFFVVTFAGIFLRCYGCILVSSRFIDRDGFRTLSRNGFFRSWLFYVRGLFLFCYSLFRFSVNPIHTYRSTFSSAAQLRMLFVFVLFYERVCSNVKTINDEDKSAPSRPFDR